jgi:septum site-determining protein MinD
MDAIITAMVSGKGGTGKSTTAVFCGAALAALNKKTVVIELAPGMRSVDIIAGVSDKAVFDLDDVLCGHISPAKAVVQSERYEGLFILPAPYVAASITPENVKQLCTIMRPHFQHIILDVAAGIGIPFDTAAAIAHRVIIIETPDIIALRDGRALVDMLSDKIEYIRLILNKVNAERIFNTNALQDLDEAIDIVSARLLGVIPESEIIHTAAVCGGTLKPKSIEDEIFTAIAKRMIGEDVPLIFQ